MKIIKYTYKFRLKPTKDQEILLNKHFGSIRWTYNYFLNQRKQEYLDHKKSLNYNQQSAQLTQLKKQDDTKWLKETNSQALQYSLKCLEGAYQNFFMGRGKFPKFKSRRSRNSFTVNQHVRSQGKMIHFPKFQEGIKMIMEREIKGKIKKATISKEPSGKYFITILTEKQYIPVPKSGKKVGIDLGLKDFLVLSNGSKTKNHRFLKHYLKQLKVQQKHLARKVRGSNRYEKQRIKVAKIHEKITNSRMDVIHKTTKSLVDSYDVIYLEDLNIKGMIKNPKLSRSIQDVSWGKFIETLRYKAQWNDKEVIHIDRFFPSSKTCNKCGWINNSLELNDRNWTCKCGEILDRDVNAAINILKEGLRMDIKDTSAGTADHKHGAKIRPSNGKSYEVLKEKTLI